MIQGEGKKYDKGKLRFALLTRALAEPLAAMAAVMSFGALKYDDNSWQTVPNAKSRYEDAMDRHLNSWKMGNYFDGETGLHHLAHAGINLLFLLWFEMQEIKVLHNQTDFTKFKEPKFEQK